MPVTNCNSTDLRGYLPYCLWFSDRWGDIDVVVKRASLKPDDDTGCRLEELERECEAYRGLQSLHGVSLPIMHSVYYTSDTLYLVLGHVQGHHPHEMREPASPAQTKNALLVS